MDDRHAKIMDKFQSRNVPDNLPIGLKKGGRNRLAEYLGEEGFNKGVEIGVQWGKFSEKLCKANPNIELYSIDPWHSRRLKARMDEKFNESTQRLAPYNATVIRKFSMDALADFKNNSLDFVYIDGNHSFDYVCPDIIYWSHKVRKGGVVACHDYFHHRNGGIVHAVDAYTRSHYINPWYVTYEIMPTAFWFKP